MTHSASVRSEPYGFLSDGRAVQQFVIRNKFGMEMRVIEYGCVVTHLFVPDGLGTALDVVLGLERLEDYEQKSPFFGAVVGRFANRIAGGRFTLDGCTYELATNNSPGGRPCALHGGVRGFAVALWQGRVVMGVHGEGVEFHLISPDGEEGYPGRVELTVTYWLTDDNAWRIDYTANSDKATPLNLTQHAFFNLAGEGNGDILAHELTLCSDHFTPVNEGLIPTGEIRSVHGTALDFTTPHAIGARIHADEEQLILGRGYDHNFVLTNSSGELAKAATVFEPSSRRVLEVFTTEPGFQVYTGNFLDGTLSGKCGGIYGERTGLCLETQHFPDSPNQPAFPNSILRPGTPFQSTTVYKFGTR